MTHQVQPPAGTFALGTHLRVGQPDRRHQVTPCELGQHQGVDSVRLARERGQTLHLLRVCDLDLPAHQLESVVHEPRAVHRLDRGADRLAAAIKPLVQAAKPVGVRR
jgi:hypothetical protein